MKIVINDIVASKGGAFEILRQFYQYVRENDIENDWVFLLGLNYLEETERIKVISLPDIKSSRIKRLSFDFFKGKKFIQQFEPDVVLSLQNIITFGLKVPQYVYIHQAIPYQTVKRFSFFKSNERTLAVYQHIIGKLITYSAHKADGVIVQTDWMKKAVSKKAKISEDSIITALPNCNTAVSVTNISLERNRFFYPTSNSVYKNNDLILKACDILNSMGINEFRVLMTLQPGTIQHKNIECIGYVNRDYLNREYARSILLFPSYIETVGLPLLEAASFGVPILVSNCQYSIEVLNNYDNVRFFDPFSAEELAEQMLKVMTNGLRIKGAQGQKEYHSWEKVCEFIGNLKEGEKGDL